MTEAEQAKLHENLTAVQDDLCILISEWIQLSTTSSGTDALFALSESIRRSGWNLEDLQRLLAVAVVTVAGAS